MPIDDQLRVTAPRREERWVRLMGGPLGARQHGVPPGAEPGFRIVVRRDGAGNTLSRPIIYELDERPHPKFGEVAVYSGFASDDDIRRWLNREGE